MFILAYGGVEMDTVRLPVLINDMLLTALLRRGHLRFRLSRNSGFDASVERGAQALVRTEPGEVRANR